MKQYIGRVKNRLIKISGLNDLHFHDLRHEAISRFIERGLTIPEAAYISGHKAQPIKKHSINEKRINPPICNFLVHFSPPVYYLEIKSATFS